MSDSIDPALEPFLAAPAGSDAEESALAELANRAAPVVRSVLRSKLGSASDLEPDELLNEAFLRLLRALRASKERGEAPADFAGYVAVAAYNVLHTHLRRRHRTRSRLRNRIRFVLESVAKFAVWDAVGGFAKWRGRNATREAIECPGYGTVDLDALDAKMIAKALEAIFTRAGAPIEIERLVEAVADGFGLSLARQELALDAREVVDERDDIETSLASRSQLAVLWTEIELLPERQRAALLLNLRDGNGAAALHLVVLLRIASLDRIAASLAWSDEELAKVWDDLPLDDKTIAARFGITRQQVINLRKSARERLTRRWLTVISPARPRRLGMSP